MLHTGFEDVIDETLIYFRANVLFRNFDVRGGADRTLIYLTLHAMQCLVACEKIEDKASGLFSTITCDFQILFKNLIYFSIRYIYGIAVRQLRELSKKPFAAPGESGWPLGGMYPAPANKSESGELLFV